MSEMSLGEHGPYSGPLNNAAATGRLRRAEVAYNE